MKDWNDYVDTHDLVVQSKASGADGGDSCARTFAGIYLSGLKQPAKSYFNFFRAVAVLESKTRPGLFRRHPDPSKWYSQWDRQSRDQMVPLLIASAIYSTNTLKRIFFRHLRRLCLFTWNTKRNFQYPTLAEHQAKSTPDVKWNYKSKMPDLTLVGIWSIYIRGFNIQALRPIVWLGDIDSLIGAIIIRYSPKRTDVMNHLLTVHHATRQMPTLINHLALKVCPIELLLSRLDTFFSPGHEAPLNELARNCLISGQ